MTASRTFMTLSIGLLAVSSAYGQNGILGGAGTYCADGWKFSASYVLEPWSPGQHVNIEGLSDVIHSDAKDGKPGTFHRVFVDPVNRTYWGYDVEVEPQGNPGSAWLRFKPLSVVADQLPTDYHPKHVPDVATFRPLPAPQVPTGTFESGQIIAIDVLNNAASGQKVVDYIQVEYEPVYVSNNAGPRDFAVTDVLLHLTSASLRINSTDVPPASTIADRSLKSRLVWLAVPGGGRFLLSLHPYPGYSFQRAGVVTRFGFSFSLNGDKYELLSRTQLTEASGNWNLYVLSLPSSTRAPGQAFSYGELNSVEEFVSKVP
jgi:hypothetical protein